MLDPSDWPRPRLCNLSAIHIDRDIKKIKKIMGANLPDSTESEVISIKCQEKNKPIIITKNDFMVVGL